MDIEVLIDCTGISLIRGKLKSPEKVHSGRRRGAKGRDLNVMGWRVRIGRLLRHLRNIIREISCDNDKYSNYWVFSRS